MCTNLLPSVEYDRLVAHAASVPPVEELLKENQPVDEERKALRTQTLKKLALVLKVWARMVVYQTGQPDKVVSQKHLKLLPFGSYKYDDTSKDSDIDLLCVTSRYITRKHFFHDLCRLFEGMKEVEAFTVITSAFVPLMKMKFNGVALDICFTQLNCSCVPSKFDLAYISKMPIDEIDDKSAASLNGYIITSKIAELVPNFHTFTTTLNVIKLWAKRRGVYSALLGFLASEDLLWLPFTRFCKSEIYFLSLQKICQLYPNETPTTLTSIFFHFYSVWDWTQPISLCLSPSFPTPRTSFTPLPTNPWIIPADCSRDVMQIMTPLSPSTNTARNVSHSSLLILREEFKKASAVTDRCTTSNNEKENGWNRLFEANTKKDFFHKYPVYVQVVMGALKREGEGEKKGGEEVRKWEGWTKSRIAGLVKSLEQQEGVEFAHLHTKEFVQHSTTSGVPEMVHMFIGLSMDDHVPHALPCASTTQFVRCVSAWREFDPLRMGVRVDFVPVSHVPHFVHA